MEKTKKINGKKLYRVNYLQGFYKNPKDKNSWVEIQQSDYIWASDKENAEYQFIMSDRAWGWVQIISIRQTERQS